MQSLNDFETANATDKFDLGYIDAFYRRLMDPRRDNVTSVLEVGVQEGRSLKLWRDFFPSATVYGVDVCDLQSLATQERIFAMGGVDAYKDTTIQRLREYEPHGFDVIIDDGPHTFASQMWFLQKYPALLKPGGFLVLEDIINVAWTPQLVECLASRNGKTTVVHMRDKIRSERLREIWQAGLDVIIWETN